MAVKDFALDILGTSFNIRVDEDPIYLDMIFSRYRTAIENTQNLFGLKDPLVIAILTGFLLSDELHKSKNLNEPFTSLEEAQEAEKLALSIIARIDRVLEDESAGKI